jgi:DNA polymerase-3 subunit delta'
MIFHDIKGHEATCALLENSLKQGRMHSSLLFIGPEGIGKFLVARQLAKAVNCDNPDEPGCGRCPSCLKIDKGQHPDVHIIDSSGMGLDADEPASGDDTTEHSSQTIKIEQIRQLQRQGSLKAYEARKKVFIVNDAHRMNAEAANCLLKTLEEPSDGSLIILVTSKPNLLFKTVISRCQTIKFHPFTADMLEEILARDYRMNQTEARFLAVFSEGSLGRALTLRGTSIMLEKNRVIDELALHKNSRSAPWHVENRAVLRQHLNILATWFRDIYICKAGLDESAFMHADRVAEINACARAYSWVALEEGLKFISDAIYYTEQNINPKLLISNIRAVL